MKRKGSFFMAQKKQTPDKGRYFFRWHRGGGFRAVRLARTVEGIARSYAISPLHTPDKENPFEHYHVVYKHSNTITLEGARKAIVGGIFKNDYLLLLHHPRLYQRYLIHLDDPDKEQFSAGRESIEIINGFPST